ncbi:hypothetical protein CDD81_2371 [Ophiocordyceps australis]|uniref:Uncharacterized protein n=1 Tax=Ophiocordyceps australis TaxID=1399860 RepID=A0A2C5XY87_9HYPO|nr:hypothetical protein CDD81_2371 [Ophiocordyceps australis]
MPTWNFAQTKTFILDLYQARTDGLRCDDASLDRLFDTLCEKFKERWAYRSWSPARFQGKYCHLSRMWAAFDEAAEIGQATINKKGKVKMDAAARSFVGNNYGDDMVNSLVNKGFILNGKITILVWTILFSTEDAILGTLRPGSDDFVKIEQDDVEGAPLRALEDAPPTRLSSWVEQQVVCTSPKQRTKPRHTKQDAANESISLQFTPVSPAQPADSKTTPKVKDEAEAKRTGKDLAAKTRAPGADDLEKAVRDSARFASKHGMHHLVGLVTWLKADANNPIVWNALESDECKLSWTQTGL